MNTQSQRQVDFPGRIYLLGLLTFPLFFLVNYLFNHQRAWLVWLPQSRATYTLAILLPFGVLLPSLALGWFIRRQGGNYQALGATLTWRDLLMTCIAVVLGLLNLYFAVGRTLAQAVDPLGMIFHLFIWLLSASIAEVMVFIGMIFHATEAGVQQVWRGPGSRFAGAISAILVSAVAFGLFHFSYYPPWDTWYWVLALIPVWLMAATFYTLTRSLVATVMFDNILAVVGFVRNGQTIPGSNGLGVMIDGIAIVAVIALVVALGSAKRVLPRQDLARQHV